MLQPHSARSRAVLTGIVVAALGFVACEMPTETEQELGQRVSIDTKMGEQAFSDPGGSWSWEVQLDEQKLEALRELQGVEDVTVTRSKDGSTFHHEILLWGEDIDSDAVLHLIKDAGDDSKVEISSVAHVVKETWRSKIGRELLHLDTDADVSKEQFKAQILEQLEAQGFTGSKVHELETDGTHRAFFIEAAPEGFEGEAHGTITIEIDDDEDN